MSESDNNKQPEPQNAGFEPLLPEVSKTETLPHTHQQQQQKDWTSEAVARAQQRGHGGIL